VRTKGGQQRLRVGSGLKETEIRQREKEEAKSEQYGKER
jgi:hypothetical protein